MMLGFKIKPWMVAAIATVLAFVAKGVGGALASFKLFGIPLLKPLSVPFSLLGKLAMPLLVLTVVLLLAKFLFRALRKVAKKGLARKVTAQTADNTVDEEVVARTSSESRGTQTKDLHGFDN